MVEAQRDSRILGRERKSRAELSGDDKLREFDVKNFSFRDQPQSPQVLGLPLECLT